NEDITDDFVWHTALTVESLGTLAQRGNGGAVDILRGYVEHGYLWNDAVHRLAQVPGGKAVEGLDAVVCARFSTGEALEDATRYGCLNPQELWGHWRETNPCIARLLTEVEEVHRSWADKRGVQAPNIEYREISLKNLLETVNSQNYSKAQKVIASKVKQSDRETLLYGLSLDNPFQWALAFRGLSQLNLQHLAYDVVFNNMKSFFEAGVERKGRVLNIAYTTLSVLPSSKILHLARKWFDAPEWYLNIIGARLLEDHATHDDIPRLKVALGESLQLEEGHADYRACDILEVLTKFQDIGQLPEVESAFIEAEYSYIRIKAARAMKANAPDYFSRTYAFECLWDCEAQTRMVGSEGVPLDMPGVRQRLVALSNDEYEDEAVRTTAKLRLDQQ
ncbi:MAG: hypothetical protein ABIO92_09685, partial [Chloroflexia bacterium]